MLSDMQTGKATPASTILNRKVLPTLWPYLSKFEDWNRRAANLTAFLVSRQATPDKVELWVTELAELASEVDAAFAQFEVAAAALPRHSRVDDLRAAFRRLQAILRKALAPMPLG